MPPVPKPKRTRQKHFFKEWRDHLGHTQEAVINRLGWTQSKLSRIEAGNTPYNQDDLEMLEEAYGISKELLLSVNPKKEGKVVDLMAIFATMNEQERADAVKAVQFSLDLSRSRASSS